MDSTQPVLAPVFGKNLIRERVSEMAARIDARYGRAPLVAICVLKGACIFFADLVRKLQNPNLELDFVRLASYGKSSQSSGFVRFSKDIEVDIKSKNVLIVEDIVDSGRTMKFLLTQLAARSPESIAIAALVEKHERRVADVHVDFSGFNLPSGFLVGYGLDYAEKYRCLPDICELIFNE